jgi:hypothetical protein
VPLDEDEVGRARADDLVGDRDVAAARVADFGRPHRTSFPHPRPECQGRRQPNFTLSSFVFVVWQVGPAVLAGNAAAPSANPPHHDDGKEADASSRASGLRSRLRQNIAGRPF